MGRKLKRCSEVDLNVRREKVERLSKEEEYVLKIRSEQAGQNKAPGVP